jgi:hypothetical protein
MGKGAFRLNRAGVGLSKPGFVRNTGEGLGLTRPTMQDNLSIVRALLLRQSHFPWIFQFSFATFENHMDGR